MKILTPGEIYTAEIKFEKLVPHGDYSNTDVTSPKITVYDPNGNKVIDAQDLIKSATGLYYYHVQTIQRWPVGNYDVLITATSGAYTTRVIQKSSFRLEQ